jgi:hypothetical protein
MGGITDLGGVDMFEDGDKKRSKLQHQTFSPVFFLNKK